ncbi:hypothetical protein ACGP04_11245 [Piscirickettsia salmonis]|uniref:hypothetical protein n=1 Tax=Piscirickettsia salmonis TaxID=1238 RepID=UPI003750EC16
MDLDFENLDINCKRAAFSIGPYIELTLYRLLLILIVILELVMPGFIDVNGPIFTYLKDKVDEIKVVINRSLTGAAFDEALALKHKECFDHVESGLINLTNLANTPLAKLYMDYYYDSVKVSCPELQITQAKMIILEQLRLTVFEKKDLKTDWAAKQAAKGKKKGSRDVQVLAQGEGEVKKDVHTKGEAELIFEAIEKSLKEIVKIFDDTLKEFSSQYLWMVIDKLKLSQDVVEKIFADPKPFRESYQFLKEIGFDQKEYVKKVFADPCVFLKNYQYLKDTGLNTKGHVRVMLDEDECFEQKFDSACYLGFKDKSSEISDLKTQLESKDAEIAALKAALEKSKETGADLQKKVAKKNLQILSLQNRVAGQYYELTLRTGHKHFNRLSSSKAI